MAQNKAFNTQTSNFDQYMQQLEELLRKNRGSAVHQGFDVNPNAMLLPGKVKNASGLGDQVVSNDLQYSKYVPESIGFSAPQAGNIQPYSAPPLDIPQTTQDGGGMKAQDFFNQVAQAMYAPRLPSEQSTPELDNIYQNTGQKYAVASNQDGSVTYNDGSIGVQQTESYPMASMQDGNVLWSDGFVRAQLPEYMQGSGVDALSQGLFGSNQTVTQPYGNINPIEPTPGNVNLGTDFRTRDLQQGEIKNFFAQPLEVVQIYNQAAAGSGYVGSRENQGYGNSILLRRQDGSMIRVSHFDQLGNYQIGDMIQPGQVIGTPGSTGNVTGEHADVELYGIDGNIMAPDQFLAGVRNSSTSTDPLYKYEGQITPQAASTQQPPQPQFSQQTPQPQPQAPQQNIRQSIDDAKSFAQQLVAQPAQTIEQVQPTGTTGLGLTELSRGDVAGARQEIQQSAPAIARFAQNPVKTTAIGAIERAQPTGESGLGLTELAQGDVLGAKTEIGQTAKRIEQAQPTGAFGLGLTELAQGDIAGAGREIGQSTRGLFDTAKSTVQQLPQQAGNLVSKAKDAFGTIQSPGLNQKPSTLDLDPNAKQVGEVSGSTQSFSQPKLSSDIRDPFFKQGGAQQYSEFIQPDAEQKLGGALDTSLFKDAFYRIPEAIGNVFSGTSQIGAATDKYKDFLQSKIQPGFDKPYSEELKTEDGNVYKYLTPIKEYFENKFWQDKLSGTPDELGGEQQYSEDSPTIKTQAFRGERQTIPGDAPTFKSNMASLFSEGGDRSAKFVQGIGDKIASIYKPHPFSRTVAQPERLQASFEPEIASYELPEAQRQFVEKAKPRPTLEDYRRQGKTAAQYYAETGQQSTLDAIDKDTRKNIDLNSGNISRVGGSPDRHGGVATGPNQNYSSQAGYEARQEASNKAAGGVSGGSKQNFTPSYANYSSASGNASYSPPPPSQSKQQPQSNPFKKVWNKVKTWF